MSEQGLRRAWLLGTAFRGQTARAARGIALCLLAQAAAGCGGRSEQETGGAPQGTHELLLLDELNQPLAQTQALLDGQVVTTNDDGRAELGTLPATYDAVVAVGTNVRAFMGLTARSPTIVIANVGLDNSREHVARVNISNPSTPSKQILFYTAGVTGGKISAQDLGTNRDTQSSWAFVSWAGSGDVALSAQAFLADVDPETQSVVGYSGFASKVWPNAAQQTSVDWSPEFQVPTFKTKKIHVELSLAADVSVEWYSVSVRQASGETGPIGTFYEGASADLLVPDLPGATFDIAAPVAGPGGSFQVLMHGVSAGATVHAEGGAGIQQLAPEDAQQNVTPETSFGWSAQPGYVYELLAFSDSNTFPRYDYLIATSTPTARLPDTSALGLPFPSGVTLQWIARSEQGHASLNDYASAPDVGTGTGFSDFRTFTTAP